MILRPREVLLYDMVYEEVERDRWSTLVAF